MKDLLNNNPSYLESLFEGLNEHAIIARTDKKGKILFANNNFCKISGFKREELLGQDHRIINSGYHDKDFFKQMWETLQSGRSWRGQIKNKTKDGQFYWMDTTISPLLDENNEVAEFVSIRYDITQQKQLEFDLQKTVEEKNSTLSFLHSIQDNAAYAIVSGTKDGLVTSFNKTAEKMTGYSAEEIIGKQTPALWHDLDEVVERSKEYSKKLGEPIEPGFDTFICHSRLGLKNEFEWTYVHKDGHRIPVMINITALKDSNGQISGYIGIAVDLTKRKALEEQLKASNRNLNLALEGSGLGIWDWDLRNDSVSFDRRWAEMLGLDVEKIPMELSTWESRVHPEDIKGCYADIKNYMDGKTKSYENIHRMKHADGHWVYILDKGRFSEWDESGKPIRFTGTHLDISESEQSKRKIALLYEHSPFGFAFCDMDGKLLEVNDKYKEITGYTFDELEKLTYWDLTPIKYEQQEAEQLDSLAKTGHYGPYKKEYINKKGESIPVELNGFIVKDFDGQQGIWSIVEDVSEKIAFEEEMKKQKQLASHHAKLASIGTLAAGVGHEINNPLAIINGYVSSVQNKIKKGNISCDEVSAYLAKVKLASQRIARIVQGLRTFSRADSADIDRFNPVEAAKETFDMVHEIYQKDGVQLILSKNFSNQNFVTTGNRGKFQQVLMNLIANARDAVQDKTDKQIELKLSFQNNNLQLTIKDNGCGISEEIQNKIFDPFFTTKDVNQGTGIGLSMVHNFVDEMNGTIAVTSEIGIGTEFTLTFPVTPATTTTSHQMEVDFPQYQARALVVDDEEAIRDLLTMNLEDCGLEVETAENGQVAYDLYTKNPDRYDLVITDMKMPVMDGEKLITSLRANSEIKQPKVVVMTGGVKVNFEDKNSPLNSLIDGHFFKPFDEEDINQILDKCLRHKQLHRKAS